MMILGNSETKKRKSDKFSLAIQKHIFYIFFMLKTHLAHNLGSGSIWFEVDAVA